MPSGPQIKGWEVPKWGRLVGYHRFKLLIFTQVVYKRLGKLLPRLFADRRSPEGEMLRADIDNPPNAPGE
jgi:hypothetical protein